MHVFLIYISLVYGPSQLVGCIMRGGCWLHAGWHDQLGALFILLCQHPALGRHRSDALVSSLSKQPYPTYSSPKQKGR